MLLRAALLASVVSAASPSSEQDLVARLTAQGLLNPGDRHELDKGGIVTKLLDTSNKSEIRTLTVLRIDVSEPEFLRCVRDPGCLKRAGEMVGGGALPRSPAARDFGTVSLDKKEFGYLGRCRIGVCDVRLSADDIRRFQGEVDWKIPGSQVQAEATFREMLARLANSYEQAGDAALPTYSNNPRPLQVGQSLRALLGTSLPLLDQVPALVERMERFPEGADPAGDDFLYWYKERVWRETVIALNHVFVHEETYGSSKAVFVVAKQLFASNYYDSAIEVSELYSPHDGGPATLAFLSAARMDVGRPEGFNIFERVLIHHFIPHGLQHWFEGIRARLKAADPAARYGSSRMTN